MEEGRILLLYFSYYQTSSTRNSEDNLNTPVEFNVETQERPKERKNSLHSSVYKLIVMMFCRLFVCMYVLRLWQASQIFIRIKYKMRQTSLLKWTLSKKKRNKNIHNKSWNHPRDALQRGHVAYLVKVSFLLLSSIHSVMLTYNNVQMTVLDRIYFHSNRFSSKFPNMKKGSFYLYFFLSLLVISTRANSFVIFLTTPFRSNQIM